MPLRQHSLFTQVNNERLRHHLSLGWCCLGNYDVPVGVARLDETLFFHTLGPRSLVFNCPLHNSAPSRVILNDARKHGVRRVRSELVGICVQRLRPAFFCEMPPLVRLRGASLSRRRLRIGPILNFEVLGRWIYKVCLTAVHITGGLIRLPRVHYVGGDLLYLDFSLLLPLH